MASYTDVTTKHATLTTTTVDTLTFAAPKYAVTISNEHATEILSVTFGRRGTTAATPTARGDGTYVIPGTTIGGAGSMRTYSFGGVTSLKILGNGNVYNVEAS